MALLSQSTIDFSLTPREQINLIGHEEPLNYLKKRWEAKEIFPVWLIYGEQGIGKTTFSYRLARDILCTDQSHIWDPDTINRQITIQSYPNMMVLERERTKDNKLKPVMTLDQVKKIFSFLQNSPSIPGWRVVIIEDADLLNKNAANGLLKILEEPPAKTLILLIAQSKGQVLPTIRSRCAHLNLKPLGPSEIAKSFSDIQSSERTSYNLVHTLAQGRLGKIQEFETLKIDELCLNLLRALAESIKGNTKSSEGFIQKITDTEAEFQATIELISWWAHRLSLAGHSISFAPLDDSIQKAQEWFLKRFSPLHWLNVYQAIRRILESSLNTYLDKKHLLFGLFFAFECPDQAALIFKSETL